MVDVSRAFWRTFPVTPRTGVAQACAFALLSGLLGGGLAPVASAQIAPPDRGRDASNRVVAADSKIIVLAQRAEQSVADVAASSEVLNAEDIEREQIRDIRELVREMPNMSVRRAPARFSATGFATGREGNAGINIRGLDGNRVLMMVDGVRLPRSYAFGSASFGRDYVDVTLLKRVEVLKGPASALYGSDGLGGVVNFITAQPRDFLRGGANWGGKAAMSYSGDDEGARLSATLAAVSGSHEWLMTLTGDEAKALENKGANTSSNANRTAPNPQKDRGSGALAKWVWRPSVAWSHELGLERVTKQNEYELLTARTPPPASGPLPATAVVQSNAWSSSERERVSWAARGQIASTLADRLQVLAATQSARAREYAFEDRNTAPDRVRDVFYWERIHQLNVQADKTLRLGDVEHRVSYGLDRIQTRVRNLNDGITPPFGESFPLKRFPDTTETTTAAYVQNRIRFGDWEMTPALRWDSFSIRASQQGFSPPSTTPAASLSGNATSPKFSALWRATPNVRLYANVASGFRAPSASQLNSFFENFTSFYKTVPNPNLRPESSTGVELGARMRFGPLALETAAFSNRYKDLISEFQQVSGAGVAGNPTVFQSINIGRARLEGFELKGSWDFGRWMAGDVSAQIGYGQTRGKDLVSGRPLNSVDPARTQIALGWRGSSAGLRLIATHQAAKRAADVNAAALVGGGATPFLTPSATTLDLSGDWQITPAVRLVASVINATDQKYWLWNSVRGVAATSTVVDAYTQPGRHANLSIVARF